MPISCHDAMFFILNSKQSDKEDLDTSTWGSQQEAVGIKGVERRLKNKRGQRGHCSCRLKVQHDETN